VLSLRHGFSNKTTSLILLALLVLTPAMVPFAHAQPTVVATVNVGAQPYGVAYDSGKGEVFVSNTNSNTTSVISDSNNAVVATVIVGSGPEGVTYDSAKGEVFVADTRVGIVSVISDASNKVIANVTVGKSPYRVAYDPAMGEIFVANSGSKSVSVISDSDNEVVTNITVGTHPTVSPTTPPREKCSLRMVAPTPYPLSLTAPTRSSRTYRWEARRMG
jgi:YVTN family beta-propeller protein